jgi:lipopolysaccharide/colanic/teichoic acid biosynthesis glycosyltransferase
VARRLWEGWKRLAKRLGDVQARILLVVFYFLFFAPFALLARWSSDPLGIKPESRKGWQPRTQRAENWKELAMRQF